MSEVFAGVAGARLVDDPFPHLTSDRTLDRDVADTLIGEMPSFDVLTQADPSGGSARIPLPSRLALADPRPSRRWKEALQACLDAMPRLLTDVVRRLRPQILAAYPDFESRFAPLAELRAVPRHAAAKRRDEVGMDAQVVTNLPAAADGTGVRGPHLDMPDKLISGLVYLRADEDDSQGGDLELYAPIGDTRPTFDAGNGTALEGLRLARTYARRHNLLVLPLNSARSIHGVSPRRRTPHARYHLHLVGELAAPLFEIPRPSGNLA